jgi:hypothetical protein
MEALDMEYTLRSKIDPVRLVTRWVIFHGIAGIGRISTSLAASFERGIGLSVHRILILYLFKTLTRLLRIRYGWREWTLTKSTIIMNQIYARILCC